VTENTETLPEQTEPLPEPSETDPPGEILAKPINPENIQAPPLPLSQTRTDRERLLFERRKFKQQEDQIPAEKLGKTKLEYFDIYTIVDAVEKHHGCLNPEASESEKKWLHDYFLDILKIPMVLTTIKVLPVPLNLRGTGVPYTWK